MPPASGGRLARLERGLAAGQAGGPSGCSVEVVRLDEAGRVLGVTSLNPSPSAGGRGRGEAGAGRGDAVVVVRLAGVSMDDL